VKGENKTSSFPIKFEKLVYDPVHGYIGLTEQELKFVNTIIFQRLHNIRQLGTAFFVYPGATHSRFAHSLGAMCVMNKIAQRLAELEIIKDVDDVKKLRLAALLHDVGHFPFSHTLERPMRRRHEQISTYLIKNSCLKDCFDTYTPDEISSIITKEYVEKPVYSLLVSSDLDVDRTDYLMRDAHETGVSYGFIDVERLIRTITIDKDQHLAVEDKGRQALENFLMARYHMYQTVYYHKTVVCFELMLQRIYGKLMENKKAYSYEQICKLSDEEFYDFNDNYIWRLLRENQKDPEALGDLISRFRKRQRLKKIKEIQGISVSGKEKPEYSKLSLIEVPYQLEGLSKQSGVPEDWIFYSKPKPLEILSKADDETAIRVVNEDGTSIPIAQDPTSIISVFYDRCFLSSRIYTKDEFEKDLLKGIKKCFAV
jgi:HD superfamily phosphohydrolase